jgi:rubrerythrin
MLTLGSPIRYVLRSETALHERRNCGTTVEDADERCPACGATDVPTFHPDS